MQVQGVLTIFFWPWLSCGREGLIFLKYTVIKSRNFQKIYSEKRTTPFAKIYPLDSDLSGGQHYPAFEQLVAALLCKDRILK